MNTLSHISRALLVAVLLMLPVAAFAQEATVAGTVTDSTGGVLPGVTIKAVHDGRTSPSCRPAAAPTPSLPTHQQ